jgi:hypothetical protein
MDRRRFLHMAIAGTAGVALAGCADADLTKSATKKRPPARAKRRPPHPSPPTVPTVRQTTLPSGVVVPTATWLMAENNRPGTLDWIVNFVQPDHALEGFASHVSAASGDDVALFVNTTAKAVRVQAYRMGYYQGLGGRLIYQSDLVGAGPQPAPTVSLGIGTVS